RFRKPPTSAVGGEADAGAISPLCGGESKINILAKLSVRFCPRGDRYAAPTGALRYLPLPPVSPSRHLGGPHLLARLFELGFGLADPLRGLPCLLAVDRLALDHLVLDQRQELGLGHLE